MSKCKFGSILFRTGHGTAPRHPKLRNLTNAQAHELMDQLRKMKGKRARNSSRKEKRDSND